MGETPEPATQEPLFRREALEHRASLKGPGDVVRVAPTWTSWAFYLLAGLFVAALVAMSLVEIDLYARGPVGRDERGRVVVLLPAALAPEAAPGRPVELGEAGAKVVSSDQSLLYPAEVRRRYGVAVAAPSIAVVTSATDAPVGTTARVLLESEPVIVALVPGLKALFGEP